MSHAWSEYYEAFYRALATVQDEGPSTPPLTSRSQYGTNGRQATHPLDHGLDLRERIMVRYHWQVGLERDKAGRQNPQTRQAQTEEAREDQGKNDRRQQAAQADQTQEIKERQEIM